MRSQLPFSHRVFIFGALNAYGVKITIKYTNHFYDLEVKGQGQTCLKSILGFKTRVPLSFSDGGCSIKQ